MTDLMKQILEVLAKDGGRLTPNDIGYRCGIAPRGGAQYRSRGPGSIIAPAITALDRRELIKMTARPDGMTGTAYRITSAGREKLRD